MMKIFKLAAGLALAAMLTACGGGGGNPGTQVPGSGNTSTGTSGTTTTPVSNTTTSVVTPSSIEIFASANEVLSSGAQITITAVVKNINNAGMADQPVVFSVDGGATLSGPQSVTNADGFATVRLSAGANKSLRNVNVSVTSGTATGIITLPVTGTRISLTGPSEVKLGDSATFVARLQDSGGAPIARGSVSISSSLGNTFNTSTLETDPSGNVQFIYTANRGGTDTIVVSGLGASSRSVVGVSNIDLVVLSPGSGTGVLVNTTQTVRVRYLNAGSAVVGEPISFSSTRGVLSASTVTTDGNGVASVDVSSSSSGPATVLAQVVGVGQVSLPINFLATNPSTLVLQANPSAVLPNSAGNTANQSTLEATVQDASGNAVSGRQVDFSIVVDDGNNGRLSPSNAITDANGRAQVQFIPGELPTRTNGVQLRAAVAGTSIGGTASLTVNGGALFITIGFGNTISNIDETTYSKPFSVFVTDANGNPVGNQRITLSAIPSSYGKGFLGWNGTVWTVDPTATPPIGARTACPNEDLNANGSLDLVPTNEDRDGDGRLSPGSPALIVPGTVTTDSQGRAPFSLNYSEVHAGWVTVQLVAAASVGGTESRSSMFFALSPLASDVSNEAIPPAGAVSPYGTTQSCTSP